jgi:UDP-N-acetylglucosamine acyltransferase
MGIHPTAVIDPKAQIATDVEIGPFVVIRGQVKIGSGTVIDSHVTVGHTNSIVEIGQKNHILSGAAIGGPPQDLSYKGEVTRLIVGNNNTIREFATLNCGTMKDQGVTRIGDNNLLMAYVHIAHDCIIGNSTVIANAAQLAGHVQVQDFARIGGMVGIVQFIRIGAYAYIGGASNVNKDILPYSIADGNWAKIRAMNKVGLQRAGFSKEVIDNVYKAIKILIMGERTKDEALAAITSECEPLPEVLSLVDFVRTSDAGIAR